MYLAYYVRESLRQGAPSVERAWDFIEETEREMFRNDVSGLKDRVLNAVERDQLALPPVPEPEVPPEKSGPGSDMVS